MRKFKLVPICILAIIGSGCSAFSRCDLASEKNWYKLHDKASQIALEYDSVSFEQYQSNKDIFDDLKEQHKVITSKIKYIQKYDFNGVCRLNNHWNTGYNDYADKLRTMIKDKSYSSDTYFNDALKIKYDNKLKDIEHVEKRTLAEQKRKIERQNYLRKGGKIYQLHLQVMNSTYLYQGEFRSYNQCKDRGKIIDYAAHEITGYKCTRVYL